MLTKKICYDGDHDDRMRERSERQEAARLAAGLPEPVYHWTPPNPTKDIWGKPIKPKRKRTFSK